MKRTLGALLLVLMVCGGDDARVPVDDRGGGAGSGGGSASGGRGGTGAGGTGGIAGAAGGAGGEQTHDAGTNAAGVGGSPLKMDGGAAGAAPGPVVDRTERKLSSFSFTAKEADPAATQALGKQQAFLDTRATPVGQLVVYLHGAGAPGTCGSAEMGRLLADLGFHVLMPCYGSDYGVANCGNDIGGCRREAFEGVDHHALIDIKPPDSIETRVVRALGYLATKHAAGDWTYFVEGGKPRWGSIVISGQSHGASSAAYIGKIRPVARVVSLAGPLDTNQAWLEMPSMSPLERFYAFTHTGDAQHKGHLASFEALGLPGNPTVVDGMSPPYDRAHRLVSSAPTGDGHGAVQAGGSSPKTGGAYVYAPVWRYLYGR